MIAAEQLDEFIDATAGLADGDANHENLALRIAAAYDGEMTASEVVNLQHGRWPEVNARLRARRERMAHELALAEAGAARQSVEQRVSVDVSVEISQSFRQIDDSGLSPEDAAALKALLAESQNAPDAETRAGKFVKAVEFVADKGPKVVDAVMKAGGAISQLPWPQM